MNQKSYNSISGFIFLVITIVHLLRIFNGWSVRIDAFSLPVWASWAAVILGAYLTSQGLRKR